MDLIYTNDFDETEVFNLKKLLTAFLLCLMSVFLAIGVSALNEYTPGQDGSFQVNFTGSPNADYAVFVIPGTYDESQYLARLRAMSPADFVYYDVQSANGVGTVTFSKIVPSRYVDSTVIISGGDLSQPILAGHFYPDGAKDEETVVVRVDKNKFLVAGRFGTQQKTQLETIKLDSFGFPSYTDTKVQYAITPETQDIYVDRDENLCVTPFSQEGVYELVASVGDNIDVAKITIERTYPSHFLYFAPRENKPNLYVISSRIGPMIETIKKPKIGNLPINSTAAC